MSLSQSLIQEFKMIAREEFGREISDSEAVRDTQWLVNYADALKELAEINHGDHA